MNINGDVAPKTTFPQLTILTERHREMLEELRFRHRLNFSETIRQGIEQIWSQHARGDQPSRAQLEA